MKTKITKRHGKVRRYSDGDKTVVASQQVLHPSLEKLVAMAEELSLGLKFYSVLQNPLEQSLPRNFEEEDLV